MSLSHIIKIQKINFFTNFYIFKRLKDTNIKLSVIARGISIGDELEYADEVTLGRSILDRTPYENSLVQ